MAGIYNGPARGGTRGGKDQVGERHVFPIHSPCLVLLLLVMCLAPAAPLPPLLLILCSLLLIHCVQFQWEDVKEDKQGQNYLGHSVKAANGRSCRLPVPQRLLALPTPPRARPLHATLSSSLCTGRRPMLR